MSEKTNQITLIILNAVKNLSVGKYKLAEFLKGSKAKDIANLSSQQGYGGLLWHDIQTIIGFIEQLEEMELLKRLTFHDYYSALELTKAGKKVLDEKINVELQIIKKEKPMTIGESEKMTFDMFKSGKTIEEIAKIRNLAISTIYDHFYKLVSNKYFSSSEFIPENIIKQVLEAKSKLPKAPKLKEIKDILPEEITYNEIKCVLADKTSENMKKDEVNNEDDDLWEEGYFAQTMSSAEMQEKMKTFHMKHDEDMNYNCKKCNKKISAHNKDWHDGMCDN